MSKKIMVIDDEENILKLLRYNLAKEGYTAMGITSGEEATKKAQTELPDLIVLDIMLPGVDGFEVCKVLSNNPKTAQIPIIMLTSKTEDVDIVTGLDLGAEDYITKPFSPRVLIARIRAALRRRSKKTISDDSILKVKDLLIHPSRHEVLVDGNDVELTATEFDIHYFLCQRPGWVFSRDQIINAVKGGDHPVMDRSVDVQIVGLRKKLGSIGKHIETVRGVGYRVKALESQ